MCFLSWDWVSCSTLTYATPVSDSQVLGLKVCTTTLVSSEMGIETRTCSMLGEHSTNWAISPAHSGTMWVAVVPFVLTLTLKRPQGCLEPFRNKDQKYSIISHAPTTEVPDSGFEWHKSFTDFLSILKWSQSLQVFIPGSKATDRSPVALRQASTGKCLRTVRYLCLL